MTAAGRIKRQWPKLDELQKLFLRSPTMSGPSRPRAPLDSMYPEEDGVHIWNYRGTVCTIVRCDWYAEEVEKLKASEFAHELAYSINWMGKKIGNLQGYARFDKRPLYERSYNGIATYIPAPGGLTFAQSYVDGSFVYGYDTAHIDQEGLQFKDVNWHVVQVEFMVDAIIIARRLEKAYRRARKQEQKIVVLSELDRRLRLRGKQINVMENFGLMLRLLSGEV